LKENMHVKSRQKNTYQQNLKKECNNIDCAEYDREIEADHLTDFPQLSWIVIIKTLLYWRSSLEKPQTKHSSRKLWKTTKKIIHHKLRTFLWNSFLRMKQVEREEWEWMRIGRGFNIYIYIYERERNFII